jgi:hypothetical protein
VYCGGSHNDAYFFVDGVHLHTFWYVRVRLLCVYIQHVIKECSRMLKYNIMNNMEVCQRFGRRHCNSKNRSAACLLGLVFDLEDRGSMFFRNVRKILLDYTNNHIPKESTLHSLLRELYTRINRRMQSLKAVFSCKL